MATKFQMQARSSIDGLLHCWLATTPDWLGSGFPGPGSANDVAISSAPFGGGVTSGSSISPTGIVSAETLGSPSLNQSGGSLYLGADAIGEFAIGVVPIGAALQTSGSGGLITLSPPGIGSAETLGTPLVVIAGGGSNAGQGAIGEFAIGVR